MATSVFDVYSITEEYLEGLFITWPTSYEALVGRAELKAGALEEPSISHAYTGLTPPIHRRRMGSRHRVCGRCGYRRCPDRQRSVRHPGCSSLLNQRPTALGAKVIAAAGSAEKIGISKQYGGADYGIDYTKRGWQKEVMKITGGHGVDVVFDPVGMIKGISGGCHVIHARVSDTLLCLDCLKCIAWKGRAVVVGFAAGPIEKVRYACERQLSIY